MSKFGKLLLEVDKPARMTITHPTTRQPLKTADGEVGFIEVYSSDSSKARNLQQALLRRRLNMKKGERLTPEELEEQHLDFLCAVTSGWRLVDPDGDAIDLPFSQSNARELYSEPGLAWLREQVDEYVNERANFSKASSKN